MSKDHYGDWQKKLYPEPPKRPSRNVAMLIVIWFFVVVWAVAMSLAMSLAMR